MSEVAVLNGAAVQDVEVTAVGAVRARRAATVLTWRFNDDHVCSWQGCGTWEVQLNSRAYCDGTYAWGEYSRYGYKGWATDDGTKNIFTISYSRTFLGFKGDPSRTELYASHDARIGDAFSTGTAYVHRHYPGNCGGAWLVTGRP